MKKTLLLFLTLLLSFQWMLAQKDWTYLVYLNGSDLEQAAKGNSGTNDLLEMTRAGSTNNVNVIVTTGGTNKPGWKEIKRFKIENGQQVPIPFSAADNDMANTQNLTDFINWAITTYPADKYVLDLWNHGMDIRGYGHDENSDKEIKIPALQAAIANSNFIRQGNRFEIIGFDACLMATIEVQNTVKAYGNYFVASEETEPGHGWNYTPIIQAMENRSATDGAELGRVIADNFKAQAQEFGTVNVTLSVVDLAKVDQVVGALETLTNAMTSGGKDMIPSIQRARADAEEYSKSIQNPAQSEDMVDIGDFMKKLKSAAPALAAQADGVLSAVNSAVTYSINDHTRPNATGITMFWPHNKMENKNALAHSFSVDYNPIDFSPPVKKYLMEVYANMVGEDSEAPDGEYYEYEDEGELTAGGTSRNPGRFSAVRVKVPKELEQVKVVLAATSYLDNDDVVLLGSTLPDVERPMDDGDMVFAYEWDELWLGINGYPAYIADIFEYEVTNTDNTISYNTRVKIPAIINPDENDVGQDVIISYFREGEEADFQLESIVPETYGTGVMLTAKERIELKAGDRVMLLYQGFNETTDEEFFVVDDAAVFTIENGNEDLELGYDFLDFGDYVLGYQLQDLSQNDTVIFDPVPFIISPCPSGDSMQTPGTSCDDENPATSDDKIQADSCSCLGIEITTGCPAPAEATVTGDGNRRVTLNWQNVPNAQNYTLQIRLKGQNAWIITATIKPSQVNIYGPTSNFEYRIKTNCSGEISNYGPIYEFAIPTTGGLIAATSRERGQPIPDLFIEGNQSSLSPNPVQTVLNLAHITTTMQSNLLIYNSQGQIVQEQKLPYGQTTHAVNLNRLKGGLYLCVVKEDGKISFSQKFVKD